MKAVIHIGTPKSGTTTIQAFLALNREALASQGFRYQPVDPRHSAQLELGLTGVIRSGGMAKEPNQKNDLRARTREEQVAYVDRFEAMLHDGVRTWPEPVYLASSEQVHAWLWTRARVKALHTVLCKHFSAVHYIVYYRPQEEFILSSYSERLRRGERLSFDEHFEQRFAQMDFHQRATLWAGIAGRENLTVRLLDRTELLNGDLLDDFCAAAGIDRKPLADPPRMNASLSAEEMALYLRLGRYAPVRLKSGARNPVFMALNGLLRLGLPKPGTRLRLTDEQRDRLNAANAEANERLRADFFPHRAKLFGAP